jgi:hypothetical protein
MYETEDRRVKRLTIEAPCSALGPVHGVAGHWVADMRKVDSDLMGSPGFETHLNKTVSREPFDYPIVRHGVAPASGDDRHPFAMGRVTADVSGHGAIATAREPVHNRHISARD